MSCAGNEPSYDPIGARMIEKLLMKLRVRDELSPQEEATLRAAIADVREFPADQTVVREGEMLNVSLLLVEGLMCRYKDLRNGSRQIAELHVPGDFSDLHGFTLKKLDHNILTLTPCRIAEVPHGKLKTITEQHPHLARLLWLSTNIDAAIHREWELSLGRRSALGRTAHLFCELQVRLDIIGLATESGFQLDLTQTDLAECLGLTPVHVNRTLKELRERGAVEFRRGSVTINDLDQLQQIAEFNPGYLNLERMPR